MSALYLLSLTVWIGGMIFFSFIGAPSLFKVLPPEYAGKAVGAIFPKYYPLCYLSGFIALLSLLISAVRTGSWPVLKIILLVIMLTFTIYTSLMIYPRARSLKEELHAETNKLDVTLLQKEFHRTHRISVVNNMIVLVLGIILILITSRTLTL